MSRKSGYRQGSGCPTFSVLQGDRFVTFESLFTLEEGRLGVVVTFLATLELVKEQLIEIVQAEVLGPIHVRRGRQLKDRVTL